MELDEAITIEQRIRQLGARTRAPSSFLEQVRDLFRNKGIALSDDSSPYLPALREAFRREESIRRTTLQARHNLDRLQQHFKSIGAGYRRQLDQLKQVQRTLERRARALEDAGQDLDRPGGERRTDESRRYVSRVQKDDPFLVPGPDDLQ